MDDVLRRESLVEFFFNESDNERKLEWEKLLFMFSVFLKEICWKIMLYKCMGWKTYLR